MTTWLPRAALVVLAVGLALHNLAMSALWNVGVRDTALDAVAAWKDVLLLVALAAALVGIGSLPGLLWADRLALAYGAVVVVYWLVPQSWLGGDATARGELFALRHHAAARCVPPRPARDARPHVVEEDRVDARRRGRRALDLGARRRLPRAAAVVARLRRARLVLGAARARLPLPVRPARELDPEHRRGEPGAAARVDLLEPARDGVRPDRRPAPPRVRAASSVDDRRRRGRLRGPAVGAHARGLPRAARRAARRGGAPPLVAAGGARGRLGRGLGRVRRAVSGDRARDDVHGNGARVPAPERLGGRGELRRPVQPR